MKIGIDIRETVHEKAGKGHYSAHLVEEILKHAREEGGDKVAKADEVQKMIDQTFEMDEHKWFTGNEPSEVKEARQKALDEFKKRYKK